MQHWERSYDIFCASFTDLTQVRIPGTEHQLETQALMITVVDTQEPPQPIWWAIDPKNPPVAPETYDVTLTFHKPQTGRVILRVMPL